MTKTVIVIGSGLAGLSATLEASSQSNTKVILIEKEKQIGGNSMKATSGINSLGAPGDSREAFVQDTLTSGAGLCEPSLVHQLVDQSQQALEWLIDQSRDASGQPTLDLSVISRCGGHSVGRTHRCPPHQGRPVPVGWKLIDTLKRAILSRDQIEILTETRVTQLWMKENQVKGVKVQTSDNQSQILEADAVVLASGGFGGQTAQHLPEGQSTLLSEFAPQLVNTATTNGPWASGDGIRLGLEIGAAIRDMDQVQVHPTAFIDPKEPNAPTKFLAPESLRAHGAILLNGKGQRFTDELNLRDHVTTSIRHQTHTVHHVPQSWLSQVVTDKWMPAVYLVLPQVAAEQFGLATLGFYASKGFFKQVDLEGLAQLISIKTSDLISEFELYDQHNDTTGKTVFPCQLLPSDTYWVSLVTPAVHYTMGGLAINRKAAILNDHDQPIPGLFGAGEVTSGVHGHNRLAGNSLLECVVFGRIAGSCLST
ncbi:FAD binding domain-containing protein [Choanephora cucurbitarum]|nr:FAD binding domain-containing protein [Choanephora cucurbitarum]